jgi:hypothetical protein
MKMVKNIAIVACAASFMFANVSFHMGNNYSGLDVSPVVVTTSYGASWALNGTTSVGYDSTLGMLMSFGVGNTSLRMGWNADAGNTSIGLGFTWWNGGDGLNTSISTNYDMRGVGDASDGNLSLVVGFGF